MSSTGGFRIFDSHSHIGEWGEWRMKGNEVSPFSKEFTSKQKLRRHMSKYGVDRQIVMPHYHPDLSETFKLNQKLQKFCEIDGVYGAAFFEPSFEEESVQALEIAENSDIKALKTSAGAWKKSSYTPDSWSDEEKEIMEEILEFSAKNNIPIQFHTGKGDSDPRKLFEIVEEYPDAIYHFVHSGGIAGGHFSLLPRMLNNPEYSIYCDTSWSRGFAPRWFYRKLKQKDMLDRMMFGTDEPWGDFPGEFHKILGLKKETDISEKELEKILFKNASELYL